MVMELAVDGSALTEFERSALEHLQALYSYAMALTHNATDAEDLVQETYLRAIRSAQRAVPTGDLKSWLFTILRNLWLNRRRRYAHGPDFLSLEGDVTEAAEPTWLVDERHRPDLDFDRAMLRQELRTALGDLPDIFREVIVLRCIEEFSYSQIAQILNCPAGTVMSRLNRARAALRRRLNIYLGDSWSYVEEQP